MERPSDTILASNKYGQFVIPNEVKHKGNIKRLLRGEVHEESTVEYMKTHAGDGIIIHAGTFVGEFLPALGSIPNKVYTFEPIRRFYDCAKATLELNYPDGDHNIVMTQKALGEAEYSKKLMYKDAHGNSLGGASAMSYDDPMTMKRLKELYDISDDTEGDSYIEVETIVLDEFLPEEEKSQVSIIQFDLEGYELKALQGSIDIIRQSKPILIVETWKHWDNTVSDILNSDFFEEHIYPLGYGVVTRLHQNNVLRISNAD